MDTLNSDLRIKCERPTGALLKPIPIPHNAKIFVPPIWGEHFCGDKDIQSIEHAGFYGETEIDNPSFRTRESKPIVSSLPLE